MNTLEILTYTYSLQCRYGARTKLPLHDRPLAALTNYWIDLAVSEGHTDSEILDAMAKARAR